MSNSLLITIAVVGFLGMLFGMSEKMWNLFNVALFVVGCCVAALVFRFL